MQPTDVVAQLNTLKSETCALSVLTYRLAEQIRNTIARIEPPTEGAELREAGRRYLATASNARTAPR